jgi:type I restriction enzyme S subunit
MSWKNYKIGDFLTRIKEPVKIKAQEEYTLVTIRMYHNGVAKRSHVKGSAIKSPTLYKVRAGQFILSGIDARNRAFGIVPEELEGAVVTNDFWTHDIDTSIIDISFFYWFTTTPQFYEACIKASEGTTNRQRLQADKFYSFDVPLPSIDEQQEWVERISSIQNKHEQLDKELYQQQNYLQLLRQTILQEAVQGKLTKQASFPSKGEMSRSDRGVDEPATELLKRIKAEKEKLIKAGKLKKEKELPPITEAEIPFELPKGWAWCRLGEVLEILTDYHANGAYEKLKAKVTLLDGEDYAIMLRTTNFNSSKYDEYRYVSEEAYNFLSKSKVFPGDVIMNKIGDPGAVFFVDDRGKPMSLAMNLFLLRFNESINTYYAYLLLTSFKDYIKSFSGGTTNLTITKDAAKETLFPLPPLAEQQRIIAKVQQLQQQLSQLEAQVQQSRQYAQQLLQSVLREAFEQKGKVNEREESVSMVAEG